MASTEFVNGTPILPEWLNDVNDVVYGAPSSSLTIDNLTVDISGVFNGSLSAEGPVSLNGNVTIGNSPTDTLSVGGGGFVKDASNNIGIGVTPSAWGGVLGNAITEHRSGSWVGVQTTQPILFSGLNNYFDGTNFRYKNNGTALLFSLNGQSNQFNWETAPAGVAGANATFTSRMQLSNTGQLDLRAGAGSLRVAGHITRFESAEQTTPTATGTFVSVAHGGTRVPDMFSMVLRCKIAEHGYAVGDEIVLANALMTESTRTYQLYANATNIVFEYFTGSPSMIIVNTSGGIVGVTAANWRVVLRALWL
jgi:hypothetical protein